MGKIAISSLVVGCAAAWFGILDAAVLLAFIVAYGALWLAVGAVGAAAGDGCTYFLLDLAAVLGLDAFGVAFMVLAKSSSS